MRTSKGRTKPIPVRIVHDEPMGSTASNYKPKDSMHISVRQIQNGYIVNKHGHKDGKHYDDEFFTPRTPRLDTDARAPSRSPSRNARLGRTKI
jgi:hypothetical protein